MIIDHFSPAMVAGSGQCFRWKRTDSGYEIIAFGKRLLIENEGPEFALSCTEEEWDECWADYLDMGTDYGRVEALIASFGDRHLCECFAAGSGIRILRQDLWEMIVTFLISQNNNITRITRSVEALCDAFGGEVEGSGRRSFPSAYDIDTGRLTDKSFGLGYRAEYIANMCEYVRSDPDFLQRLAKMAYDAAREALLQMKGIGPKVADCICLFGLHHTEAFPVDTHVKQLLAKYYPDGFDTGFFPGCAGIIQQYLFYAELKNAKKR